MAEAKEMEKGVPFYQKWLRLIPLITSLALSGCAPKNIEINPPSLAMLLESNAGGLKDALNELKKMFTGMIERANKNSRMLDRLIFENEELKLLYKDTMKKFIFDYSGVEDMAKDARDSEMGKIVLEMKKTEITVVSEYLRYFENNEKTFISHADYARGKVEFFVNYQREANHILNDTEKEALKDVILDYQNKVKDFKRIIEEAARFQLELSGRLQALGATPQKPTEELKENVE